jgi:hypothetical protein
MVPIIERAGVGYVMGAMQTTVEGDLEKVMEVIMACYRHLKAAAAGIPAHVNLDAIDVPSDIVDLTNALAFDPWYAISEGTLLASVVPDSVSRISKAWTEAGIESYELGRFDTGLQHCTVCRNGRTTELVEPEIDPFWDLFFDGLRPTS